MSEPTFAEWVARRHLVFGKALNFWRTVATEDAIHTAIDQITHLMLFKNIRTGKIRLEDLKHV